MGNSFLEIPNYLTKHEGCTFSYRNACHHRGKHDEDELIQMHRRMCQELWNEIHDGAQESEELRKGLRQEQVWNLQNRRRRFGWRCLLQEMRRLVHVQEGMGRHQIQCQDKSYVAGPCTNRCVMSEEEEDEDQFGICRKKCGTTNSWSMCVIGCKAKQGICAVTCGSPTAVGCIAKCVLGEEEEEEDEDGGVCYTKCAGRSFFSKAKCLTKCKWHKNKCRVGCRDKSYVASACTNICTMRKMWGKEEQEDFEALV